MFKSLNLIYNVMKTHFHFLLLASLAVSFMQTSVFGEPQSKHMDTPSDAHIQLPASGRGDSRVAYLNQAMDQMIYDFMVDNHIPGMTLAIVQAPYIPRVVGYGLSDVQKELLASTKTLWPAGPISQAYAAVAAFQLLEQGRLDMSAPVGRYINNLPAAWKDVTVFQLLQHSAGLPNYTKCPDYDPAGRYAPAELLALVAGEKPVFAPGTEVRQSPTHFLLLAMVIDEAAGMPYEEFVQKGQFDILGLKRTLFGKDLGSVKVDPVEKNGNAHSLFKSQVGYVDPAEPAAGYAWEPGKGLVAQSLPVNLRGYADIWSTPEEISFWDIALAGSILVKDPAHRDMIYKPTKLDNGKVVSAMAGWQFPHHKGLMDVKGDTPGYSSYICRFTDPSELVCVTLTANRAGIDLTNLARRIAGALDPKLGSGQLDDDSLVLYESVHDVPVTMARIEKYLKDRGIPVFARFDHGKNAHETGLEMLPSEVIVFGSPKVGTGLMQANPGIATELPLRIAVWQDKADSVWISYPRMDKIAKAYGVENAPAVVPIRKLLEDIVSHAGSVY